MPYKSKELRNIREKETRRIRKINFYRSMGLEPLEINNPRSDLECVHCSKVTPKNGAHRFRHEKWCPHLPVVMKILDNPKMYWNRRPKKNTRQDWLLVYDD